MSARLRISLALMGCCAFPVATLAGSLFPELTNPAQPYPRTGYRDTAFPPQQYDLIGQPAAPTGVEPRPTYRQTYDQFPIPGGRYGGGVVEYVMTGGRPEPVPGQGVAPGYAAPAPVYAAPVPGYAAPVRYAAPSAIRGRLRQSRLPEYAPQPPAYYGSHPAYAAPQAAYAAPQAAYAQQASAQPVYAAPQALASGILGGSYDPVAADPGLATRPMNPMYARQMIAYAGPAHPGTILIDTPNKFLYLVQPGGRAIRYGIGVGRPGFAWSGVKTISRKAEWPDWIPPKEMLARRPDLPHHMEGGEANPLGARALYLGSSLYRIHGTNEPYTIGTNVSSGCIRMMNQDVIDLYGRVGIGTRVIVM